MTSTAFTQRVRCTLCGLDVAPGDHARVHVGLKTFVVHREECAELLLKARKVGLRAVGVIFQKRFPTAFAAMKAAYEASQEDVD